MNLKPSKERSSSLIRSGKAILAEAIGVFLYTVLGSIADTKIGGSLLNGLLLGLLLYFTRLYSEGHLHPVITIVRHLSGQSPVLWWKNYIGAQIIGGLLGGLVYTGCPYTENQGNDTIPLLSYFLFLVASILSFDLPETLSPMLIGQAATILFSINNEYMDGLNPARRMGRILHGLVYRCPSLPLAEFAWEISVCVSVVVVSLVFFSLDREKRQQGHERPQEQPPPFVQKEEKDESFSDIPLDTV